MLALKFLDISLVAIYFSGLFANIFLKQENMSLMQCFSSLLIQIGVNNILIKDLDNISDHHLFPLSPVPIHSQELFINIIMFGISLKFKLLDFPIAKKTENKLDYQISCYHILKIITACCRKHFIIIINIEQ